MVSELAQSVNILCFSKLMISSSTLIHFACTLIYLPMTMRNDTDAKSDCNQVTHYPLVSVGITFCFTNLDFRETAFIYAITSAGVIFSVTRACSLGELQQCGCQKPNEKTSNVITSAQQRARNDYTANIDNSQAQANQVYPLDDNSEFKWGGCSDNILYGYTISKQLMANQARDGRSMITDHNNEAGRLVS